MTGHYRPDALINAIQRAAAQGYAFDTILMALNAADPHIYSFSDKLLPLALKELAAPVAKQSLFFRFTDRSKG